MLLLETMRWFMASLTWKGAGFGRACIPALMKGWWRKSATGRQHHPGLFHRGDSLAGQTLMSDGRTQAPGPRGKTQPLCTPPALPVDAGHASPALWERSARQEYPVLA